ncbi:MAG: hypothetical protein ACLPY2_15030 [Bryobacteraceae bacterium]|jgi:hypothetical protein
MKTVVAREILHALTAAALVDPQEAEALEEGTMNPSKPPAAMGTVHHSTRRIGAQLFITQFAERGQYAGQ